MQLGCTLGLGMQLAQPFGLAFAALMTTTLAFSLAFAFPFVPANSVLEHLVRIRKVEADLWTHNVLTLLPTPPGWSLSNPSGGLPLTHQRVEFFNKLGDLRARFFSELLHKRRDESRFGSLKSPPSKVLMNSRTEVNLQGQCYRGPLGTSNESRAS